jgi:hypothetical protein
VRWREFIENPRVDVRGFGHGMRTVAAESVPEAKVNGRPEIIEFIA